MSRTREVELYEERSWGVFLGFFRNNLDLLSAEDEDDLLNLIRHSKGPLLPNFFSEPIIEAKIFVNQNTYHTFIQYKSYAKLMIPRSLLYLLRI